ncbi:GNAT family N-acetyltransferase [Actinocorallia sp. B10E7]|uniref:GNAT family N-acetyltransferase n=1 Tax=Actinocorallia sp. B10E7 TaxID=3153558 RepID=UPI00325E3F3F
MSKIREAVPEDNEALLTLAEQCPMAGDISLCVDRRPDFFALSRLEGDPWLVGVVDLGDGPVACAGVARREVYLNGSPTPIVYIGDIKVLPGARRRGLARELLHWTREKACELVGPDGVKLSTIMAGNEPATRLFQEFTADGAPGAPRARLRSHSIQLLWKRRIRQAGLTVREAAPSDVPAMVEAWRRVASGRQLAPVHDEASFLEWIGAAPGLELSDYLVAFTPGGAVAGFLGLWDQHSFKQMRVVGYTPQLARVRTLTRVLAPVLKAPPLPEPGGELRYRSVVNPCAEDPIVLSALLKSAANRLHGRGYSVLTIGLDAHDPLNDALRGLVSQPSDTDVWIDPVMPGAAEIDLGGAPVHFEIGTV